MLLVELAGMVPAWRLGSTPDIFHTYRFENLDGANYTTPADGVAFNVAFNGNSIRTERIVLHTA